MVSCPFSLFSLDGRQNYENDSVGRAQVPQYVNDWRLINKNKKLSSEINLWLCFLFIFYIQQQNLSLTILQVPFNTPSCVADDMNELKEVWAEFQVLN